MNIDNFKYICIYIYIYIQLYIPILFVMRVTQNKKNSILQHDCGSISYLSISIFDPMSETMQMKGTYHLLSYKD